MSKFFSDPMGGVLSPNLLAYAQGFFCDGTRRYGVPTPFSQVKKNNYL